MIIEKEVEFQISGVILLLEESESAVYQVEDNFLGSTDTRILLASTLEEFNAALIGGSVTLALIGQTSTGYDRDSLTQMAWAASTPVIHLYTDGSDPGPAGRAFASLVHPFSPLEFRRAVRDAREMLRRARS